MFIGKLSHMSGIIQVKSAEPCHATQPVAGVAGAAPGPPRRAHPEARCGLQNALMMRLLQVFRQP
jgi:hypothetical protein